MEISVDDPYWRVTYVINENDASVLSIRITLLPYVGLVDFGFASEGFWRGCDRKRNMIVFFKNEPTPEQLAEVDELIEEASSVAV